MPETTTDLEHHYNKSIKSIRVCCLFRSVALRLELAPVCIGCYEEYMISYANHTSSASIRNERSTAEALVAPDIGPMYDLLMNDTRVLLLIWFRSRPVLIEHKRGGI